MKFFGELKLQKYCQSCSSNYLFRLEKRFIKEGSNIRSEGEENFSRGLQGVHVAACGVRYGWGLHPTPGKIFILGALKSAQYIVGTKHHEAHNLCGHGHLFVTCQVTNKCPCFFAFLSLIILQ